jgi:hypothetical protein
MSLLRAGECFFAIVAFGSCFCWARIPRASSERNTPSDHERILLPDSTAVNGDWSMEIGQPYGLTLPLEAKGEWHQHF